MGQLLGVAWAPVETPIEALAIAPPPPPLPPAVAAVEGLEEAGAGPEGMGGGIKLTGQVRGVDGEGGSACLPARLLVLPWVCVQHMPPPCSMLCAPRFALLQSRAALMHKLAANAGLDVSNVPQIPLPQVMQPQVRRGSYGLRAGRHARTGHILAKCATSGFCSVFCLLCWCCAVLPVRCTSAPALMCLSLRLCPPPPPSQMPAALALEQGLLGPASPIPTQCLLLKNMFAPEE